MKTEKTLTEIYEANAKFEKIAAIVGACSFAFMLAMTISIILL